MAATFPIPVNEKNRLRAVQGYRILNTVDGVDFDRITELASIICDVPISLISLIDENRQWIKSKVGLDINATARGLSFCQYTLQGTSPFEIEDATMDSRFKEDALVTGEAGIRFYAGFPLIDPDGYALGTLCVIDRKVKALTQAQKKILKILAEETTSRIAGEAKKDDLKDFEHFFQLSNDVMGIAGMNGFFKHVNPAFENLLGYDAHYLITTPFINLVHPDDIESTILEVKKLLEGENTVNFINRYKTSSNLYKTIQWTASPELATGNIFCVGRDITQEKLKEEKLKDSIKAQEELNKVLIEQVELVIKQDQTIEKIKEFKFLADSVPQIIWTSEPDGNLDYYNKHWFDYTGMTLEQTLGWGWEPVLHPDDLENCIKVWTESFTTGKPYEVEYRFKRATDGAYRWHLGRALAMRNDQGHIVKWFGSCTDIDEYKRALDLENKIGQYEDFNRIVAHNLRGPAGSIDMILDLVEETDSATERNEFLGMLRQSSTTLNHTLDDLMKVMEVRNNKSMVYEDCDLGTIVNGIECMLKGQIFSKNAIIETNFESSSIKFPKIYLESIFYNMISNSLKYSRADVAPKILITSKASNENIILNFSDNGLGIDLKLHGQNIFKLNKIFHRGFDSKGVGLFMTKTQIETFGGKITVESEPNVGTTFTIIFS